MRNLRPVPCVISGVVERWPPAGQWHDWRCQLRRPCMSTRPGRRPVTRAAWASSSACRLRACGRPGRWMTRALGRLPLFAGLHAAASLVCITRALGDPGQDEPRWLIQLRDKLTKTARTHRN
jgi:hypothetical protein